jgi:hypothetical protein
LVCTKWGKQRHHSQEVERRFEEVVSRLQADLLLLHLRREASCLSDFSSCLTFHHRDAADKIIEVSVLAARHNKREKALAKIGKCDALCVSCHAKLHWAKLYAEDVAE